MRAEKAGFNPEEMSGKREYKITIDQSPADQEQYERWFDNLLSSLDEIDEEKLSKAESIHASNQEVSDVLGTVRLLRSAKNKESLIETVARNSIYKFSDVASRLSTDSRTAEVGRVVTTMAESAHFLASLRFPEALKKQADSRDEDMADKVQESKDKLKGLRIS